MPPALDPFMLTAAAEVGLGSMAVVDVDVVAEVVVEFGAPSGGTLPVGDLTAVPEVDKIRDDGCTIGCGGCNAGVAVVC